MENNFDMENLLCPVCGSDYGHITRVEQIRCEYGLGARIIIEGECGHVWRFRMVPFKGNLILRNESVECLDMLDSWEWRDLRR